MSSIKERDGALYFYNTKRPIPPFTEEDRWVGPFTQPELDDFMAKGDIADFDLAYMRKHGYVKAQVSRNHRYLRMMGLMKGNVYKHTGGSDGEPQAA